MEKGRNSAYVIQDSVLRNIFVSRRDEVTEGWRRWHMRRLMNCTAWQMCFWRTYQEEQGVLVSGVDGVEAYFSHWWGNLREPNT